MGQYDTCIKRVLVLGKDTIQVDVSQYYAGQIILPRALRGIGATITAAQQVMSAMPYYLIQN